LVRGGAVVVCCGQTLAVVDAFADFLLTFEALL
jgi:hypothetical protein